MLRMWKVQCGTKTKETTTVQPPTDDSFHVTGGSVCTRVSVCIFFLCVRAGSHCVVMGLSHLMNNEHSSQIRMKDFYHLNSIVLFHCILIYTIFINSAAWL